MTAQAIDVERAPVSADESRTGSPQVVEELMRAAWNRTPISLADVDAAAALQTRVDRKYLVTADQFAQLDERLGERFRVLEIDGRRLSAYASVYFDTPSLSFYREHRQGRRRRCKVRVRTYVDDGARFIEVKTKGRRGATVKHRIPHDDRSDRLNSRSGAFVDAVIRREYGQCAPRLVPALESCYRRCTFVDPVGGERLTCDVELSWSDGKGRRVGPDKILLETKTTGQGRVDEALSALGIRPVRMSKYAVGTALLHPELAANPWHRLLEREFGGRLR